MIPFAGLHSESRVIKNEILSAIKRVLNRGKYILDAELNLFEREFADFLGVKFCVGVASGTDAITLSLTSLGVGSGDEVIVPAMTAFPTITGILRSGARPNFIDISDKDGLLDISQLEKVFNRRTKAIIPVHLYGQSCNMGKITAWARKNKVLIVEDCAQSVGATYFGQFTGSFGDCAAFSFYPTKNLGAYGDGGAVVTNHPKIYTKLLELRNYGRSKEGRFSEVGFNSRLDEIQAAILRVKLKYLHQWNSRRYAIAKHYRQFLSPYKLVEERPYGKPVYHLFVINEVDRNRMRNYLNNCDIETAFHYPYHSDNRSFFSVLKNKPCPVAYRWALRVISIPIHPFLTDSQVSYICKKLNTYKMRIGGR